MTEMRNNSLVSHMSANPSDRSGGGSANDVLTGKSLALLADQLIRIAEDLRRSSAAEQGVARNGFNPTAAQKSALGSSASTLPTNSDGSLRIETLAALKEAEDAANGDLATRRVAYAQIARKIYATRRHRSNIFGDMELFGEPAWDILLDLYIAQVERKTVSVSSACIGSAAPPTTGLRWLGVLAEQDLILREHDPDDQRRVLVRLTEKGMAAMDEYFSSTAA